MKLTYYVGDVPMHFWNRIKTSKTFYAASVVMLGSAGLALDGTIGWKVALVGGAIGAAQIFVRDMKAKAELAANAVNPDVHNVSVETKH